MNLSLNCLWEHVLKSSTVLSTCTVRGGSEAVMQPLSAVNSWFYVNMWKPMRRNTYEACIRELIGPLFAELLFCYYLYQCFFLVSQAVAHPSLTSSLKFRQNWNHRTGLSERSPLLMSTNGNSSGYSSGCFWARAVQTVLHHHWYTSNSPVDFKWQH